MTGWPSHQMTGWQDDGKLRRRLTGWYIFFIKLHKPTEPWHIHIDLLNILMLTPLFQFKNSPYRKSHQSSSNHVFHFNRKPSDGGFTKNIIDQSVLEKGWSWRRSPHHQNISADQVWMFSSVSKSTTADLSSLESQNILWRMDEANSTIYLPI